METKIYTSYAEIDRDLEILKLQKEIDLHKLALSVEKTIDSLSPGSLMQNVLGNVGTVVTKHDWLYKLVVPFLIRRFMK